MYKFKTKPYEHQLAAFNSSWKAPYHALFMEMGTGKTKVIIDSLGALFEKKEVTHALIVAPKGVFDNCVQGEIPLHLPEELLLFPVAGPAAQSRQRCEHLQCLLIQGHWLVVGGQR